MPAALVYTSEDRSILLPHYRRWLVDPFISLIPAHIHPNAITHAGHALCLAGALLVTVVRTPRSWPFAGMVLLLQAYLWCDNADGAHARRTKQSSVHGEFLDHGLDLLNTAYIAAMTVATFHPSPAWSVAMMTLIPGGASITAWEQAETGVYRLGLLNQIEACVMITLTALVTALAGREFWSEHAVARLFFLVWPTVTISFGYVRALVRVYAARRPVGIAIGFLTLQACIVAGACLGGVSAFAGATLVTAVNLYFGIQMLAFRFANAPPRPGKPLFAGLLCAAGWLACEATGRRVPPGVFLPSSIALILVFAVASIREAWRGMRVLARTETAAS